MEDFFDSIRADLSKEKTLLEKRSEIMCAPYRGQKARTSSGLWNPTESEMESFLAKIGEARFLYYDDTLLIWDSEECDHSQVSNAEFGFSVYNRLHLDKAKKVLMGYIWPPDPKDEEGAPAWQFHGSFVKNPWDLASKNKRFKNAGFSKDKLIGTQRQVAEGFDGSLNEVMVRIGDRDFMLEVVTTEEEISQGLSGRKYLNSGSGMLFVFPSEEIASFWMKDCNFDLDLIFLDSSGRITQIEGMRADLRLQGESDQQYESRLQVYQSQEPARYAIEVPYGEAFGSGALVGDVVSLPMQEDIHPADEYINILKEASRSKDFIILKHQFFRELNREKMIDALINPKSERSIINFIRKTSKKSVRYLQDSSGNLWIWDSEDALHMDVAKSIDVYYYDSVSGEMFISQKGGSLLMNMLTGTTKKIKNKILSNLADDSIVDKYLEDLEESSRSKDFIILTDKNFEKLSKKEMIDAVVNPRSESQIRRFTMRTKRKSSRFIDDKKGGAWVWDSVDALHVDVARSVGIGLRDAIYGQFFVDPDDSGRIVCALSSWTGGREDIKNKALKAISKEEMTDDDMEKYLRGWDDIQGFDESTDEMYESNRSKDFIILTNKNFEKLSKKEMIDAVVNPKSESQIYRFTMRTERKSSRFIDDKKGRAWVWDAVDALHIDVAKSVGMGLRDAVYGQFFADPDDPRKLIHMIHNGRREECKNKALKALTKEKMTDDQVDKYLGNMNYIQGFDESTDQVYESNRSKDFIVIKRSRFVAKDKMIDALINPRSESQIRSFTKNTKYNESRFIIDPKSKKLWVWDAEDALHDDVTESLSLNKDKIGRGMIIIDSGHMYAELFTDYGLSYSEIYNIGNHALNDIMSDPDEEWEEDDDLIEAKIFKTKYGDRLLVNPTLEEITSFMQNPNNYPQMRWVMDVEGKIYFGNAYEITHSGMMSSILPGTGVYLHDDALRYGFSLGAVTLVDGRGGKPTKDGDRLAWSVYGIDREERAEHGVPQFYWKSTLMSSPWSKRYNIKSSEIGTWHGGD